jgi:hypothetical protein
MAGFERFSIDLAAILFALLNLALGLWIRKRKPVLIFPKNVWGGMSLMFLPYLIYMTLRLIVESLNSDYVMLSLAISLLGMLMTVVPFLLLVFAIAHIWWLFNITETMLVEGLSEALEKHGIEYSLHRSTSPISRFSGLSRIKVDFPRSRSSITITLASLGRAWMHVKGKRRIQNCEMLVSDFRQALTAMQYDGHTAVVPFFSIAAVSIAAVVLWAIL